MLRRACLVQLGRCDRACIFAAADDVAELLIPFIRSAGGVSDVTLIECRVSRGRAWATSTRMRFGAASRLSPDSSRYLSQHRLAAGALDFLVGARRASARLVLVERRRTMVETLARVARASSPCWQAPSSAAMLKLASPIARSYERHARRNGLTGRDSAGVSMMTVVNVTVAPWWIAAVRSGSMTHALSAKLLRD